MAKPRNSITVFPSLTLHSAHIRRREMKLDHSNKRSAREQHVYVRAHTCGWCGQCTDWTAVGTRVVLCCAVGAGVVCRVRVNSMHSTREESTHHF